MPALCGSGHLLKYIGLDLFEVMIQLGRCLSRRESPTAVGLSFGPRGKLERSMGAKQGPVTSTSIFPRTLKQRIKLMLFIF